MFYIRKVLHTSFFPIPDPRIRNTGCCFWGHAKQIHHSSLNKHKKDNSLKSLSFCPVWRRNRWKPVSLHPWDQGRNERATPRLWGKQIFTVFLFDSSYQLCSRWSSVVDRSLVGSKSKSHFHLRSRQYLQMYYDILLWTVLYKQFFESVLQIRARMEPYHFAGSSFARRL